MELEFTATKQFGADTRLGYFWGEADENDSLEFMKTSVCRCLCIRISNSAWIFKVGSQSMQKSHFYIVNLEPESDLRN